MDGGVELAWSYFELLGAGRVDEALALLHPEGTWWTCGSRRSKPMSEHVGLVAGVLDAIPMTYELHETHEDGDTVVLELSSRAELPSGGRYENVYAFVVRLEAGRIMHVREYSDTAHLAEVAPEVKARYAGGDGS